MHGPHERLPASRRCAGSRSILLLRLPRCHSSWPACPGTGSVRSGTHRGTALRLRDADRPARYHLAYILPLTGVPAVSRGALRPGPWWCGVGPRRSRQAGRRGRDSRALESCRNPAVPETQESPTVAPFDLESLRPGAPRALARPLAGRLPEQYRLRWCSGLHAARIRSVPAKRNCVIRAVASGGTNSYAELARAISAPSGPNVA